MNKIGDFLEFLLGGCGSQIVHIAIEITTSKIEKFIITLLKGIQVNSSTTLKKKN